MKTFKRSFLAYNIVSIIIGIATSNISKVIAHVILGSGMIYLIVEERDNE